MTRSPAIEYAKRGIRINVNCPGLVDTPLIAKMLVESKDFADHLVDSHPYRAHREGKRDRRRA